LSVSDPDLELVRDLRSDDADTRRRALGLLFERYSRRVFNVAWRVLGDWAGAQDVTQDVFLQLGRRIGTWRGDAGLSSWIYRVTVNRAIDARRRELRRPAQRMDEAALEGVTARLGPRSEAPMEALDRSQEAARVREALATLSPKLRAIAVLRYLEGLSYQELAEVLHCSIGTVKSRLNRAHAALAKVLG
jgi:RNA polymerase sigma-70 factor (ECF subfamily)